MKNLINIIGMYKCGTSWLLSALCAHPDLVGIREFDLVRASVGTEDSKRWFGLLKKRMVLNTVEKRRESFFAKSPFCRVNKNLLAEIDGLSTQASLAKFIEDRGFDRWPGKGSERKAADVQTPQTFFDLRYEDACRLYDYVSSAKTPEVLFDGFCRTLLTLADTPSGLVLKAADQVAVFDSLNALAPLSKKVLIIRDGRDAAISARHYRALMAKEKAPWFKGENNYWSLLKGWNDRAGKARQLMEKDEIYVLRYEDLTVDFTKTFKALLEWLELDSSDAIIKSIQDKTSFEAVTGRKRGEEADAVVRKGAIYEWFDELDEEEKKQAWNLAGGNLEYFGYSNQASDEVTE